VDQRIEQLRGSLVVSCQALPHEPLYSSFIMGRMARAAKEGGARGIRANTKNDIAEIKRTVDLPIIGIVKKDFKNSEIYITPTMKEIEELISVQPDIIALDATDRLRPGDVALEQFYHQVRTKYPKQKLMADCSAVSEAVRADRLGFDFIGTTMVGYTKQSAGFQIEKNDFEIVRKILAAVSCKVIAEGNINTPEKARRVIELGCFSVVVGSAITRPQRITKSFADALR